MNEFEDSSDLPQRRQRRPVDRHVGQRMRERRRLLGLSRAELAKALELSVQQVQKYESGDSTISASRLHQIGQHLAVTPSYFFDDMPELVASSAPLPSALTTDSQPSPREIRQMISAYRSITLASLRHQLYELARSLARTQLRDESPI